MSWTSSADLRAQVSRWWQRGDLLRACVGADTTDWPRRLTLKTPRASDLSERFDAVRAWVEALRSTPHVRIVWREWTHRVQGRQQIPAEAWLDAPAAALAFIGKTPQAERYAALWQQALAAQPALRPWLVKRPLQALELAPAAWERLLAVVAWLQVHPRPGVYLREVDAPGVDSKFIETHRGVLAEWLDLALEPAAIEADAHGATRFAERYGFRTKPLLIRFRPLDRGILWLPGCENPADMTLDAASFARLALPLERVFITENEINYLAFPRVPHALVIFGAGYGWDALAPAAWLRRCALYYWGDIDTHGFAILDQLRGHFPYAQSLLMDQATLQAHRASWMSEFNPARHDLQHLTGAEQALYDDLRHDRIQPGLRLEQERVGYSWLMARLRELGLNSLL